MKSVLCGDELERIETHVDHVIEGTVLCDSHKDRLVVRRRVDARDPVRALGEAVRYLGRKHTTLRGIVQALEERELRRVRGRRVLDAVDLLDHDVRVSLDVARVVDLLRRAEVVRRRVHEVARREPADRHLHGERRVRLDCVQVLREHKLGGRHVVD